MTCPFTKVLYKSCFTFSTTSKSSTTTSKSSTTTSKSSTTTSILSTHASDVYNSSSFQQWLNTPVLKIQNGIYVPNIPNRLNLSDKYLASKIYYWYYCWGSQIKNNKIPMIAFLSLLSLLQCNNNYGGSFWCIFYFIQVTFFIFCMQIFKFFFTTM